MADSEQATQRARNLTEKGLALFEEEYGRRFNRVEQAWKVIESLIDKVPTMDTDHELITVQQNIETSSQKYDELSNDLILYCDRTNINQSIDCARSLKLVNQGRRILIETAMRQVTSRVQQIKLEEMTHASSTHSVSSSQRSGASSVRTIKAKAEAARVRLKYIEMGADLKKKQALMEFNEAKLKKEKSDLAIDMEVLEQKCEVEATEAEIGVMEAESSGSQALSIDSVLAKSEQIDPKVRTQDFVRQDNDIRINDGQKEVTSVPLNPKAHEFQFNVSQENCTQVVENNSAVSELTRFLLKKDMLLSRLTHFNDTPENYRIWKFSFKNVMNELDATDVEEMDLLQKWTGPESRRHVNSVKAANIANPALAVKRIWQRLEDRYGCPEMLESSLKRRIESFPRLAAKDSCRLYDLADLVSEIEAIKEDDQLRSLFAHYDSSTGVNPIVNKLPQFLQEKWTTTATRYMESHHVVYPPFSVFAQFVREQSKIRNNPSFLYQSVSSKSSSSTVFEKKERVPTVSVNKTDAEDYQNDGQSVTVEKNTSEEFCPLHKTGHSLNNCRSFRLKPIQERLAFLRENRLCFKCCEGEHLKRDCAKTVKCLICKESHATAMHISRNSPAVMPHGGEASTKVHNDQGTVNSKCTQLCGNTVGGKSCAKLVLIKAYLSDDPSNSIKTYAIIDEQSNRSLAKSEFFTKLNIHSQEYDYLLSSCSGTESASGRKADNCIVVESLDGVDKFELPSVIECNNIPNMRNEIPVPEVALQYAHLNDIADKIPPLESNADILLLIGRDIPEVHHILDQRIGPRGTPYGQQLHLGWVIIGEACLGKVHKTDVIHVNKTHVLGNGRGSILEPCPNEFNVKGDIDKIGSTIFQRTREDEKIGMSIQDHQFLDTMEREFERHSSGNWTSPLPFHENRQRLPNNRAQALKRARTLHSSLLRDPKKRDHMLTFMQGVIDEQHAEEAPPLKEGTECWYLPVFGVYHPKKPEKIRAVFDSSASHNGVSLNDVLIGGPDLTNNLLGVLMRFRKNSVAVTADIQQMFYCFRVREDHKDFLRFLWYKDNDFHKPLIEYRMNVHVFGNRPSPAVATFGLRKAVTFASKDNRDVEHFVKRDFYVDDGLTSLPTSEEAISLFRRTQQILSDGGNIRLHKIASNSQTVMQAFPQHDLAKDLKDLDLGNDDLPLQRTLGQSWDLLSDSFTFQVSDDQKPITRRGILSVINSLFDPIGFLAPVTIKGKCFLRDLETSDWDHPIPDDKQSEWVAWRSSLQVLKEVRIRRTYCSMSLDASDGVRKELHVFSDASENAVAAVAYLKTITATGKEEIGFVFGKSKLAPKHGNTIPRLELCAAVLAVEIYEVISEELEIGFDSVRFYSDSKVVLGYIHNDKRRFYVYISNRVQRIRKSTVPEQWTYVPTHLNPADPGTRSVSAADIQNSIWLVGPTSLMLDNAVSEDYELQQPDNDKEVRPVITNLKTVGEEVSQGSLGSHRFSKFSKWTKLVEAISRLRYVAQAYSGHQGCKQFKPKTVEAFKLAQDHVIKVVQRESYDEEISCLERGAPCPKSSSIVSLDPYLDDDGILRVGGRLKNAALPLCEKHPVLVPGHHHIALLLVRHHHENVQHQGRHISEGALRSAGFWITGGKRLVSSTIHKCVVCRRLRGKLSHQKMADLPEDRLEQTPPFTYVGVDTFGPWQIITRRTRGGQANSKRWAVLFTCLTIRAIHIEVVEELSSSAFINALRRFLAIRGKVKEFRSDRGTNFTGACDELKINTIQVEKDEISDFLYKNDVVWKFNVPHSSHMGGVWERMIGIVRRILDNMLINTKELTHDVIVTLMAEVCAIVNSRPLVPISTDVNNPDVLSPATLLTLKSEFQEQLVEPLDLKDMLRSQWKRAKHLSDTFWCRWRKEFLQSLQKRIKWKSDQDNISVGDVVILRNQEVGRIYWPLGRVNRVFPSPDGRVRKVEVTITKDNKRCAYIRPITELILLINAQ